MMFGSYPLLIHAQTERFLRQLIEKHFPDFPYSQLSKKMQKRMIHYVWINRLAAEWFCILRNQKINQNEEKVGLAMGLVTPLYDALNDEKQMTYAEIKAQMKIKSGNENSFQLLAYLYNFILEEHVKPQLFNQYLDLTAAAQDRSISLRKPLCRSEREQIMDLKGGSSLLLYRSALHHWISPTENKFINKLGASLQMLNDIFDLQRDRQEQINTYIQSFPTVAEIREQFKQKIREVQEWGWKLEYSPKSKKKFLQLNTLVFATGLVCLDNLSSIEIRYGTFSPSNCPQELLICDMDKFSNKLSSFRKCLQWEYHLH